MTATTEERHQQIAQRILYLFDLVIEQPDVGEDQMILGLTENGVTSDLEARLAVRLIPLGLGYLMLKELGITTFPNTFLLIDAAGKCREFSEQLLPYSRIAVNLANAAAQSQFTKYASLEAIHNLASRSAAMQGIYEYLRAGNAMTTVAQLRMEVPLFLGIAAEEMDQLT